MQWLLTLFIGNFHPIPFDKEWQNEKRKQCKKNISKDKILEHIMDVLLRRTDNYRSWCFCFPLFLHIKFIASILYLDHMLMGNYDA